jgi:hypothetical protein
VQRNLLPTMKAGFVGTGGLGSQRYAGALGQSLADVQASLTGQQYGALSQGYEKALKGALDEASLLNLTAATQGKLADTEQTKAIEGAGALTKAGTERQAYQQSLLDQPLKTAANVSGLLRNLTVPTGQTSTFVGPKAGSYSTSDLANITGVLAMLGATEKGSTGDQLYKWLGGKLSGLDPNSLLRGDGSDFIPGVRTQEEIDYAKSLGGFEG